MKSFFFIICVIIKYCFKSKNTRKHFFGPDNDDQSFISKSSHSA